MSLRCCFWNPVASLVLAVFVSMIVVVLVLPQVELPDVTSEHSCVAASYRLPHQAPPSDVSTGPGVRLEVFTKPYRVAPEERERVSADLPVKHRSIRC